MQAEKKPEESQECYKKRQAEKKPEKSQECYKKGKQRRSQRKAKNAIKKASKKKQICEKNRTASRRYTCLTGNLVGEWDLASLWVQFLKSYEMVLW
jgi:hypothetical protein